MTDKTDNPTPPAPPKDYWLFRRSAMNRSLLALIAMTIFFTLVEAFIPGSVSSLGTLSASFYLAVSTPIVGYYSNTAIAEFVNKRT